jgi:hypothetical protein
VRKKKRTRPRPLLDARERALVAQLAEAYQEFTKPGRLRSSLEHVHKLLSVIAPKKLVTLGRDAIDAAMETRLVMLALKHAAAGFGHLSRQTSRLTLSHEGVLRAVRSAGHRINSFEEICAMRSYHLASSLNRRAWKERLAALFEGIATGAPGAWGIPFNLALSFLLYFRAAQVTALYFGYDIRNDPAELEFASEVTLRSLARNADEEAETLGGLISKMMLAGELTAISQGLSKTYAEMASRGGGQLFYVQVRALANKAAKKAVQASGKEGFEAGVFRNLLEQVGKQLPKESGKKAVPLLGAVIGGGFDSWMMHRVLKGSALIYHKRFLHEKQERVQLLCG